jgi:radical SAM superfamily enzyme YgiQ (UPF0313 family)
MESNYGKFESMDYAMVGEADTIIDKLVGALNRNNDVSTLKGIIWNNGITCVLNPKADLVEDLDPIPFPARNLINNSLYIRPDTGKPQATIQISRGCPFQCTFCLTSIISGNKIRSRSVNNIIEEIEECVNKYNIKDFFFRSDNFTASRVFVHALCDKIIEKGLKINWVTNSRAKPIDYETLKKMKAAGCWLVAFGIESAGEVTLRRIKKDLTVEDSVMAIKLSKKAGLKTYCFFMLGFPWETKRDVEDTIKLARKLQCDYAEFHICTFYEGTPLYEEALRDGLLKETPFSTGRNYYEDPFDLKYLSKEDILNYRKKALIAFYGSPTYIVKRLSEIKNIGVLRNYFFYGLRLIYNLIRS